jgi:predicted ferric reductase
MNYDELQEGVPFAVVAAMGLSVISGVLLAVFIVPSLAPELAASLFGDAPKAYWYLSRSSAVAAYVALWLSMAIGLSMTNRLAHVWPGGPTAFDLHQYLSLLGLNLSLFHALILLGDRYIQYQPLEILVPFASGSYRPLWVGIGQTGFYVLVIVALSFYVRKQLGNRLWRVVHYFSMAGYLMALSHGIRSGTDSGYPGMIALYALSGVSVLFLLIYRLLGAVLPVERKVSARGSRS